MVANVFLDRSNEYIIPVNYIEFLVMLEALKYLKKEKLIQDDLYERVILQLKKSHIGN